jgi:hypothetical protein
MLENKESILTKEILFNEIMKLELLNTIKKNVIHNMDKLWFDIFQHVLYFNNYVYFESVLYYVLFNYNKYQYFCKNKDKITRIQFLNIFNQTCLIINIYANINNANINNANINANINTININNNATININNNATINIITDKDINDIINNDELFLIISATLKTFNMTFETFNILYKNNKINLLFYFFSKLKSGSYKFTNYMKTIYLYFINKDIYLAYKSCLVMLNYNKHIIIPNKIDILNATLLSYILLGN